MASVNLKIKAVCLILLLAGQEAYRIQGSAQMSLGIQKSLKPAENRWNQADKRCTWKLLRGGCSGEGCAFRPLPLDASLSESCRLSDAYMLGNATKTSRDEFVEMAAQILEEKSTKFRNGCADAKLWEVSKQLHCHRRAGRMFRSAQLLSRAAKSQEAIRGENQKHIEHALNNIAGAFGTDGQHLLEFKDKLKGEFLNIAKDPTGQFKKMIWTVSSLLSGSDRDKDQAREVIRNMPSTNLTGVSEKDAREIEKVTEELVQEYGLQKPEVVNAAWSNLDNLVPNHTDQPKGGALLQLESVDSSQYKNGLGWRLLIVAIVTILIILLLAPGWGFYGVVGGAIVTAVVVVLVLILIIMLVRFALGIRRDGNSLSSDVRDGNRGNRRGRNGRFSDRRK